MDFGVANALNFAPRFISMDPPLDFTVKYQFWVLMALQNVGSCKVAISGFSPCWAFVFGWKMVLVSFTMEWGWGRSNIHEVEWLVVQENRAHTLPYEFMGCPCSIEAMDWNPQPLPYNRIKCHQGKSNGFSQWHLAAYGSSPQPPHHSLVEYTWPLLIRCSHSQFWYFIAISNIYINSQYPMA
jgi:hypothetical protein